MKIYYEKIYKHKKDNIFSLWEIKENKNRKTMRLIRNSDACLEEYELKKVYKYQKPNSQDFKVDILTEEEVFALLA